MRIISEIKTIDNPNWVVLVFEPVVTDGSITIVRDEFFDAKMAKKLKLAPGSKLNFVDA